MHFLVTVDVEGDDAWRTRGTGTQNARGLQRLAELCSDYGAPPTFFVDPLMADKIEQPASISDAEVALHVHAWTTAPRHPHDASGKPLIIEYPEAVQRAKVETGLEALDDYNVVSHRGGRWAMDGTLLGVLRKCGVKYDSSMTPGMRWTDRGVPAMDYRKVPRGPYEAHDGDPRRPGRSGVIEFPMTVRRRGMRPVWLRPPLQGRRLSWLLDATERDMLPYAMVMVHSSELSQGTSPLTPDGAAVERVFASLTEMLDAAHQRGWRPATLKSFAASWLS